MLLLRVACNFSINQQQFLEILFQVFSSACESQNKGMHDQRQIHWNEMEKQRKSVRLHIFAWVCKLCLLGSAVFQGCCARWRSCLWKGEESSKGNTRGIYYLKLFLISVSSLSHCTKALLPFSRGWLGHSIQGGTYYVYENKFTL